ncbi:MAG: hypothetical protein OEV40_04800 [Acidimicrobiia bacterium]|nr:hypothetical protein [Acidimicrobiia bacterium]
MLRASSDALDLGIDITAVATGTAPAIRYGAELASLTLELTTNTAKEPTAQRAALLEAGGAAVAERAVGVCATFQMMNRLLDGVGAPVRSSLQGIATALGFDPAELPR